MAIGYQAGQSNQGLQSVAIGYYAGKNDQQYYSVAIGPGAGANGQGSGSVAIGYNAGCVSQKENSIAIGNYAGFFSQRENSIAIGNFSGANSSVQQNTIVLNASGANFITPQDHAFYVNPIRPNSLGANTLQYDTSTNEIVYNAAKTFVIDHPDDKNKYLVHACLEGPEAGVYYRGKSEIINDKCVNIPLPKYVENLASDFTIQITPIYNPENDKDIVYKTTEIENNSFTVYGQNGKFFWTIFGLRYNINIEPNKSEVIVKGNGPYKYI